MKANGAGDRPGRGRWTRLLEARATARSAIAGTAAGIVILAAAAVLASTGTAETTEEVRRVQAITQTLNRISVQINAEDAALRGYLATGGTEYRRAELVAKLGAARANLDWLERNNAVDRAELDAIRGGYENYNRIVSDIISHTDGGADVAGYTDLASMTFAPLRDNVLAIGDHHQQELSDYLREVNRRADILHAIAVATICVVLALFAVCARVLIGYQRRAERQAEQRLHEATHDPLTGLGNRAKLHHELDAAVRRGQASGTPFSLLLIDLDRFKEVNDTLGHHAGDDLLVEVAQRLTGGRRAGDVVVRLGGDEFALILPTAPDHQQAMEAGQRILEELRRPVALGGLLVDIDASIGVASYPVDGDGGEELLQHADVAMYAAKRRHGGVAGYDPALDSGDASRLSLQSELRQGIERGELVVFYQPKIDVATRRPCGAEALVRWQHPARGLLGPDAFIPLAEDSGLIDMVTADVLDQALAQLGRWTALGHELPVSVNVPARSLTDEAFPATIVAALARHDVPPKLLTLEITESAVVTDMERAGEVLRQLREHGVHISIDDFGTGYSSIAHLRDMPPHELKIDRSFVMKMCEDTRDETIVRAVVDLAKNLRLRVVAEGVENEDALRALGDLGCDEAQGYHISRPLPAAELTAWLDRSGMAISIS
ncbi:EAL domain-containing protein [Actinoplanes sp. NPDC023714]|uniref:putative bifunctional diguanylate cyclase/phosphodiesterase n=1 Tax=Actinoplanes sp. NPDC023714 TaxID=3154322 RepID=UPI0033FA066A